MASATYRYMAVSPATSVHSISTQLPPGVGTITIVTPPESVIDISVENASDEAKEDLDEYMSSIGYSFVEESPNPLQNGEVAVWDGSAWTYKSLSPFSGTSFPEESTTGSSPRRKLRHDFSVLNSEERHIILFKVNFSVTSPSASFRANLVIDESETLDSMIDKPGRNREVSFSGHIEPRSYSVGNHTIDIDFFRSGGTGAIKAKNARITVWRVP